MTQPFCVVVGIGPGIGLAVARRFGAAGYRLALVARRSEAVASFAKELETAGIEARGFVGDASSPCLN